MTKPKVSVIIPTFNRANLIQRSIHSLFNQTVQDFEIIIADDASTDNTEQIIKNYNDNRIIYFKLLKNSGQCVSRNQAIKIARGDYIGFLDSDDEWLPEKIEKQLSVFEKSFDPKLAAVYCGFIEKDEIKNKTEIINRDNLRGDIYVNLLSGFCPSTPTMFLVKKDTLIKVNGFDEKLPTFVDYDLWLRIAKEGYTFDFVDEPLIVKYEHAGAQIAKDPEKRKDGLELFLKKWGNEILSNVGEKGYNNFRRNKIEALVNAGLENPGENYRKNMSNSIKLLFYGRSAKLNLYLKAMKVYVFAR